MIIQTLSRAQSKDAYRRIQEGCDFLSIDWPSQLDSDYLTIRKHLVEKYYELKQSGYKDYKLDYRYSLWFYDYFRKQEWMTDRIAADYDMVCDPIRMDTNFFTLMLTVKLLTQC